MNQKWIKFALIACIVIGSFVGGMTAVLAWVSTSTTFVVSEQTMVSDVSNKWVILAPQGQLWGFSPDQVITLKVLEKKRGEQSDKMAVAVDLKALAAIPATPPEAPKEQQTNTTTTNKSEAIKPSATKVELNGIAKLHYERIAGTWYLVEIEGISLGIKPQ